MFNSNDPDIKRQKKPHNEQHHLSDDQIKRIGKELVEQLNGKGNLRHTAWRSMRLLQKDIKLYHKIIYLVLIFLGLVFTWYGTWTLIARIPIVQNPVVALVVGILMLSFTGTLYQELI